jgi:hypothetical protein
VDSELRRKGVTRSLLWQEYRADHREGFGYAWFCDRYDVWKGGFRRQSTGGVLELASGRETIAGLAGSGTISGGLAMTFNGFGTYQFDVGGQFILRKTNVLASGKTLTDDGALAVWGTMNQLGTVTIGTDAASAHLSILKSGAWDLDGGVVTGGAASGDMITIDGALANIAGASDIGVVTSDDGTIEVAAGSLDISNALGGTGPLTIDAGATLEANSVVGGTLTVDFNGASATLGLSRPREFAATIAGFAAGDTIDLLHIKATGASINASDQLVVVNGAATVATLQLSGAYSGATFTVGADKHGGANITLLTAAMAPPPAVASPHPSTHGMVAAMAGLGAAAGSAIATTARDEGWRPILLGPTAQLA